jgi:hypothetical protein
MDQNDFNPPLEIGGRWESLGTEITPPSMHSLAKSMKNMLHLRKKHHKNIKWLKCELTTLSTSITTQV